MKTLLMTLALGSVMMSVQAQTTQSTNVTHKEQPADQIQAQAKQQTERMVKDLQLSADQSNQVLQANTILYKEYGGMTAMTDKKEMESYKTKVWDRYDKSLKDILSQSQFEKYTSMKGTYESNFSTKQGTGVKTM